MGEARLADVVLDLSRALLREYDIDDIIERLCRHSAEILPGCTTGVMLLDGPEGQPELQALAVSEEWLEELERLQVAAGEGPCIDAWRQGEPIVSADLSEEPRWPVFGPAAVRADLRAVHSVPLRHRDQRLGALNLFCRDPGPLDPSDAEMATVIADIATIYLLNTRRLEDSARLAEQLQTALDSRVVIEQAKGLLAGQIRCDVEEAFDLLRQHARDHSLRLHDVAGDVVARRLVINPPA